MISRSFVDLVFILLCGAVVMLANSVQLRLADAAPARVAGGGSLDLAGRTLRVVVVGERGVSIDGEEIAASESLAARFAERDRVVILPQAPEVTHHRVLSIWSQLRAAGIEADLGVLPDRDSGGA